MNDEDKWKAVVNCDNHYDGLFYYAVKTTGIFCRPSCKAKIPLRKNVLFFDSSEKALKEGFRPCKMCRPDITDSIYEPNKELLKITNEILTNCYIKVPSLNDIARELGISHSHLVRLYKEHYGFTPKEYIVKIKVNKARELLCETDLDITTIAYEVGYRSISNFYKCFKEHTGSSPKEFRKNSKEGAMR
jgi:AraC family transcriptional regulator, regulatory protein of adaptative response / methylphosphotriester-DNA alkyltransferase methyltransferase